MEQLTTPARLSGWPRAGILAVVAAGLACLLLSSPAPVMADSDVAVSVHFVEPIAPDIRADDCFLGLDGFCGTGMVFPFGRATETIQFGAGCGGSCDLRTIYLAAGTLVLDEVASDGVCHGACIPNPALPQFASLIDTVVDGTGIFAGASGTLTGRVDLAGHTLPAGESQIRLTGVISLAG